METAKKMVERLGNKKIILRSDSEPAIWALKESATRECDVEIVLEEVPVGVRKASW